jgi:hypothetical protein
MAKITVVTMLVFFSTEVMIMLMRFQKLVRQQFKIMIVSYGKGSIEQFVFR